MKASMSFNETDASKLAESMDMAIVYIYLLTKGPAWTPDSTPETEPLQEAHLANFRRLADIRKVVINGPPVDSLMTGGDIRGVGVLKAPSMSGARDLLNTDPAVRAGRLVFEVHLYMIKKGILA